MKRVLIILALIVLIWFGYTVVIEGFQYEDLNVDIISYEGIEDKSNNMTKALAEYNKRNEDDYENALTTLDSSIKKYTESKEKYEELIAELATTEDETEEQTIYSSLSAYDIDFLLTTIGTYGNKEGVNVTMDLVKSSKYDANAKSLGYTLCNLNFTVVGEYVNTSYFIYDLEDDDELAFEIRNFAMTSDAATFTVYNLPINNATFIDSLTTSSGTTGSSSQSDSPTTKDPMADSEQNTDLPSNEQEVEQKEKSLNNTNTEN